MLSIPLEIISFQSEYQENVIRSIIEDVKNGRNGNPDVLCNEAVKFGGFVRYLDGVCKDEDGGGGYEFISSGHYVNVIGRDDDGGGGGDDDDDDDGNFDGKKKNLQLK